jgi:hypothetical protein
MTSIRAWLLPAVFLMSPLAAASANVVTDWDETAVTFIQPRTLACLPYGTCFPPVRCDRSMA